MTTLGRRLALLLLISSTIGCDRVTKYYASTELAGRPERSLLADTVRVRYVENAGGFLSLGADWPAELRVAIFTVGTGTLLVLASIAAFRMRWTASALVGFMMFVAGGASNLIDRMMRGSVVDFLNVGIGPIRTGIFNVADVAILVGAALVAIGSAWTNHEPEQ